MQKSVSLPNSLFYESVVVFHHSIVQVNVVRYQLFNIYFRTLKIKNLKTFEKMDVEDVLSDVVTMEDLKVSLYSSSI